MKYRYFILTMIMCIFLSGCTNTKEQIGSIVTEEYQAESNPAKDKKQSVDLPVTKDNNTDMNKDKQGEDEFTIEEIKDFILEADFSADSMDKDNSIGTSVIGTIDNTDVYEVIGKYDSMDKVMQLLGDYYSEEMAEVVLQKHYYAVLSGKIGFIAASGENFYEINEDSEIKLLSKDEDKIIVAMEAFNDNDDRTDIKYTLERQTSGNWLITDIDDNLYNRYDCQIRKFIWDISAIKASSYSEGYLPEYIMDENDKTAWVEGVAGDGLNEWIMLELSDSKDVEGLAVVNGYSKSKELYNKNNRVKKIRIEFSDKSTIDYKLSDDKRDYQYLDFNRKVSTNYIKIIILDVYEGYQYEDTCISEVRIY